MRLRSLRLKDVVAITGTTDIAGGPDVVYEQSFHVNDGWELEELREGIFSIRRKGMDMPVIVGGNGYAYVEIPMCSPGEHDYDTEADECRRCRFPGKTIVVAQGRDALSPEGAPPTEREPSLLEMPTHSPKKGKGHAQKGK